MSVLTIAVSQVHPIRGAQSTMNNYESTLLKQWSYHRENADKPTDKPKRHLLQAKVSGSRLREIDELVEQSDKYSSRSELVRQTVNRELRGSEVKLRNETLRKAQVIKELGDFETVESVIHQAVCKMYKEVCA